VEKFLLSDWCDIHFIEFYSVSLDEDSSACDKKLIGVAVTDVVGSGLSAVYTFFESDAGRQRGLGNYAVLWQIEYARKKKLEYVYPGFWIKDCRKMNYKTRYQPIEGLQRGKWILLEKK
jgi:arginine-tRNA-protein transferase